LGRPYKQQHQHCNQKDRIKTSEDNLTEALGTTLTQEEKAEVNKFRTVMHSPIHIAICSLGTYKMATSRENPEVSHLLSSYNRCIYESVLTQS